MDIIIPPRNLKRFTAAITCLGKIGKDLYVSFDPLDGLILSSLNEAKSAFGKFHFDSTFFDRCSAPAVVAPSSFARRNNNNNDGSDDDDEFYDSSRYVCRVPVRSVHSVLRPRKGICSLRIRSEGADDSGNHFGLKNSKKKRKRRQQQREEDNDGNEGNGEEQEERRRYSSSSRRRRNKQKNKKNNSDNNNDEIGTSEQGQNRMMLSFEFLIELTNKNSNVMEGLNNNNNGGGTFRVTHKVGVTDANGITLSASTRKRDRSEMVAPPKLWLRLLDPLRRTAEVALTIDDELNVVTATSFHPGEMQGGGGNSGDTREDNAVLKAAAEKAAVLKTETSTGIEEFDEYDFRNNRGRKKRRRRRRGHEDDDDDTDDDENDSENDDDERQKSDRPPPDVNQKVILVFSIKEAKAMLQFCAQTNSTIHDDGDALSILSFHWGGKPLVIETDGDSFSGELVLATLHHGMIASNILVGGRRESTG